jgi:antitoxin component of MazEF toxin-antitoxin module
MLRRKIQKVKESHLVVIPSQLCQALDLNSDMLMSIVIDGKKIVMTPISADQSTIGASQD